MRLEVHELLFFVIELLRLEEYVDWGCGWGWVRVRLGCSVSRGRTWIRLVDGITVVILFFLTNTFPTVITLYMMPDLHFTTHHHSQYYIYPI